MSDSKSVLIIDDDNFIQTVYKTKLEAEGFSVLQAMDGNEGNKIIEASKPDLVLLDMLMPEKDGFEVLKDIPDSFKNPIIVFSALNQEKDVEEAKKLGCSMYLPKDQYNPGQIIAEVKKALA